MILPQSLREEFLGAFRAAYRTIYIQFVAFELVLVLKLLLTTTALRWVEFPDLPRMNLHVLPKDVSEQRSKMNLAFGNLLEMLDRTPARPCA
jgi:hypothetical protein